MTIDDTRNDSTSADPPTKVLVEGLKPSTNPLRVEQPPKLPTPLQQVEAAILRAVLTAKPRKTSPKVLARRAEKEAARCKEWQDRLAPALDAGLDEKERLHRIAAVLDPYMKVKDLTPELVEIADDYLLHVGYLDLIVTGSDQWLVDAAGHLRTYKDEGWCGRVNIDHLRVGALKHLERSWGCTAAQLDGPRIEQANERAASGRPLTADCLRQEGVNGMSSWREMFDIHPAAEWFPLMSEEELKELAADIDENGLKIAPIFIAGDDGRPMLLDGRNRLDALARLGYEFASTSSEVKWTRGEESGLAAVGEPIGNSYALVMSLNVLRRHLTAEQKRELVAKLVAAQPEKSNRAIAKMANVSDKTVGIVRGKMEARAEIPHVSTRTDTKGRKQPARKRERATKTEPEPDGEPAQGTAVENLATEMPDAGEAGLASPNGAEAAAEPEPTVNGKDDRLIEDGEPESPPREGQIDLDRDPIEKIAEVICQSARCDQIVDAVSARRTLARDKAIRAARDTGATWAEIAREHRLPPRRVKEIWAQQSPTTHFVRRS